MKTIKQFIFYTMLIFTATGCMDNLVIHGNGIEATQERIVTNFNKVSSAGSFEVFITKGDQLAVSVNAEESILPYIKTSVSNNTLLIDIPGMHNVENKLPMNVYITVPELSGVKQSGSGNIITDNFTTEKMEISISGSGSIATEVETNILEASISGSGWLMLSGEASQSNLAVSGSGNIDSSNLNVNNCNAHISGSGNIQVNALKSIYAKISGSGSIFYKGNPSIEANISGSGKIIPVI